MSGLYSAIHIAQEAGLNVVAPEPGRQGILWIDDNAQDLSVATIYISRKGGITGGHGYTPDRKLVFFKGRHKIDQVVELVQRYDCTLKQAV